MPPSVRPPRTDKAARSFVCSEELWRAFEARARALECSVDWLLGEAMKRLIENKALLPASHGSAEGGTRDTPKPTPPAPEPPARPLPRLRPPPLPSRPAAPPARGLAFVVAGRRTPIQAESGFVIGRTAKGTQLVLRDPGVSRQHAIVERKGAAHVIVDMASMNGVVVNGVRVARKVLEPGDVVSIGPFDLEVVAE